jgi:hypothetical protein
MIPILFISFIVALIFSFIDANDDNAANRAFLLTGLSLYVLTCLIFYGYIYYVLLKDKN